MTDKTNHIAWAAEAIAIYQRHSPLSAAQFLRPSLRWRQWRSVILRRFQAPRPPAGDSIWVYGGGGPASATYRASSYGRSERKVSIASTRSPS